MQYLEDYISNVTDDNDNLWIHRVQYSTVIRTFVKVGEFGEEEEILVSSEDNKIMLDELYNLYLIEKTLNNQEVVINTDIKVERANFHPLYERSFQKIYDVVFKLKDDIHRLEEDRGNVNSQEVTLKKLRLVLITILQVYLTEFPTYSYIIRRYGSILRKVFIDIWTSINDIEDRRVIEEGKANKKNIIRRDSEKVPLSVAMVYISSEHRIVKAKVSYPKRKYMIDVQNMSCDCPDFVYRKFKQGLMCKHLRKFQNECKCLVYLNRIVKENLYNVPCPLKNMLSTAYDENVSF